MRRVAYASTRGGLTRQACGQEKTFYLCEDWNRAVAGDIAV